MSALAKARAALRFTTSIVRSLRGDEAAWESAIVHFENLDRRSPSPPSPIVFTGSSSFTFWSSLERDMAPLRTINRGFGGAKIGDVVRYAPRILGAHAPRAVVLFAGTNDVAGPRPATAAHVHEGFVAFTRRVHDAHPDVPIYYVGITPTPLRWRLWPIARDANARIEATTRGDSRLRYVDLEPTFLDARGLPDRSLYGFDRLHPNARGYERWTAVLRPRLLSDLG